MFRCPAWWPLVWRSRLDAAEAALSDRRVQLVGMCDAYGNALDEVRRLREVIARIQSND